MGKTRLEAFSDGVIAIIITIMVLELKVPHDDSWTALKPLFPVFLSYLLSFIYIGIYWNNHHHLMHTVSQISGKVLWANNHLLFWLSLVPFATTWMGENHFSTWPVAMYGIVLMMAGVAYFILETTLLDRAINNEELANAVGSDVKGKLSIAIYIIAIFLTFIHPYIGCLLYIFVAAMWLVPDKRIEKTLREKKRNHRAR
jgi:uncharacterized membrane protein